MDIFIWWENIYVEKIVECWLLVLFMNDYLASLPRVKCCFCVKFGPYFPFGVILIITLSCALVVNVGRTHIEYSPWDQNCANGYLFLKTYYKCWESSNSAMIAWKWRHESSVAEFTISKTTLLLTAQLSYCSRLNIWADEWIIQKILRLPDWCQIIRYRSTRLPRDKVWRNRDHM